MLVTEITDTELITTVIEQKIMLTLRRATSATTLVRRWTFMLEHYSRHYSRQGKVTSFTEAGQRPLFPALINKL